MSDALNIRLGERSYSIHFGSDLKFQVRSTLAELQAAGRRCAVVTDRHIHRQQSEALQAMIGDAPLLVLEPGEETKSLTELGRVLDFLAENRLDRSSVLVAIGGGVIGDLAGFAAASYLRGIGFYQIPTTLLAMVDSSVGGKTGINLRAGKNLVGAFHQPKAVFISTDLLVTLPPREFAAGMAEVIKYGLLGDRSLFEELEKTPLQADSPALAGVIRRCCAIKAAIVEADERETAAEGGRALLNLGHTFGHAIEQVTGYGTYLHGEAVAVGLCAAARLSRRLGYIDDVAVTRVESVVRAHALPVRLREPLPIGALTAAMARDKKVRAGTLRFVVLRALGEAATQGGIDPVLAEASFVDVGAALNVEHPTSNIQHPISNSEQTAGEV
ncbi:3-dehydroquinate synthase [Geminisphaera colitermitum]|uniref:3-dehydroquinate synthase n=1 Tax=Geminisphaera colitermitum TaxID=1148786 RepID=UPI000196504F|nr:3-dehydroquinate synthase [Geminisphaera colitermitum]